ncbi:MAG: hypothetical protein DMG38_09825 [Acidobacteria bacterium]|nr:MAG: hypothetical protein DMG38_09825 [Acidobacteriota bacterium]
MNMADVLPARAISESIRWLLLSAAAQEVLADQLRAILPSGAALGPFRPTEVCCKPGRKITAYYETFVTTKSSKGHYVRPIAVTWGPNAHADRHEETTVLAKIQADVGCFLADWQFWNRASRQAELDEMRETFLAGYAPGVPKERLVRARLYEALGLIKCAVRRVQLFEHDWASRTAGLVGRAQAVLDHLQFTFGIPRYGSAATTGEERRELR